MSEPTDASCHIATCGDFLHRFVPLLEAVSDEHRLHLDDDEIRATTVDPANVCMVNLTVSGEHLSDYVGHDGTEVGLRIGRVKPRFAYARKGRGNNDGDPVTIDVEPQRRRMITEIRRDGCWRTSGIPLMDPDSVRKEPEVPELRENYGWRSHIDAGDFAEAINSLNSDHNHVQFVITDVVDGGVSDNSTGDAVFYSASETDDGDVDDEIRFESAAEQVGDEDEPPVAYFSMDYLVDIADAVSAADVEKVIVEYGDNHPAFITASIDEYGLDATYCLAPRISDDELGAGQPSWGDSY